MNASLRPNLLRLLLLGALLLPGAAARAQAPARAAAAAPAAPPVRTPPVKVRIWTEKGNRELTVVGRTADALLLAPDAAGGNPRVELAAILRADFPVEYDRFEVAKAMRKSDWPTAIRLMSQAYEPTYPYLDLPGNSAAENVLDLGTTMMRAAARTARTAADDAARDRARRQYEAAYEIFKHCARVTWCSVGQLGVLKGCRCLLAMGKPKTAGFHVDQMEEPEPGDDAYGHYWLVKGELAALAGDFRAAMDAAVKSLCFENKDVETFPDALLLSARGYEELLEPYRARDVYYEVAKLFPRSDWSAAAVDRLRVIMAQKLTLEKEPALVESVFFGLDEDMNALVEKLFEDLAKAPAEEAEETEAAPAARPEAPVE